MSERLVLNGDPAPHIIDWYAEAPEIFEGVTCDRCGKAGSHDVIILGYEETNQIIRRHEENHA
jgi:hypothetical protein